MAQVDIPHPSPAPLPVGEGVWCGSGSSTCGQVYSVTYANVSVYEFICNGVQVMRRRGDSYMNATQILKVANFNKSQRTRILEAEMQTGVHEKIQGGYGKYQGTWVPLSRAVAFARRVGVEDKLRPIFDYKVESKSPPLAPKRVKRSLQKDEPSSRAAKTQAAVPIESSVTPSQPTPRERRKPASDFAERAPQNGRSHHGFLGTSRVVGRATEKASHVPASKPKTRAASSRASQPRSYGDSTKKRCNQTAAKTDRPKRQFSFKPSTEDPKRRRRTITGTREGELYHTPSLRSLRTPTSGGAQKFSALRYDYDLAKNHDCVSRELLDYFLSSDTRVPQTLLIPPSGLDIDVSIDEEGNTPLHWAAATSRVTVVGFLLDNFSVDVDRVNVYGQTALARAVQFRDNHDDGTFPILLDLLQPSLTHVNAFRRSILHHIAIGGSHDPTAKQASYYMERTLRKITALRFLWLLDLPDAHGETPLALSRRLGCKHLPRLLIEAGATDMLRLGMRGNNVDDDDNVCGTGSSRVPVCEIRVTDGETPLADTSRPPVEAGSSRAFTLEGPEDALKPLDGISGLAEKGLRQQVANAIDTYLKRVQEDHHACREDTEDILAEAARQLSVTRQRTKEAKKLAACLHKAAREVDREESSVSELEARLKSKMLGNQLLHIVELVRQLVVPSLLPNETSLAVSDPSAAPPCAEDLHRPQAAVSAGILPSECDGSIQVGELRADVDVLERERRSLTDTLVDLRAQSAVAGPYQKLIAKCCGVSESDVARLVSNIRGG